MNDPAARQSPPGVWLLPAHGNRLHLAPHPPGTGSVVAACGRLLAGASLPGPWTAAVSRRCAACVRASNPSNAWTGAA